MLTDERIDWLTGESSFPGDECYLGTINAASQMTQSKWTKAAGNELARLMILAPINQLNTRQPVG